MNYPEDTIAAISTPVGQGGIGIVRLSGPASLEVCGKVFRPEKKRTLSGMKTFTMRYGRVVDPGNGLQIDEAIVSVMRAPNSYTKEDIVEINCHGGMIAVKRVLELVLSNGARLAEPGEFTKRAFLNGRISLDQAEAVMDLISSRTEESMRVAVDQLKGFLSERLGSLRNSLVEVCAHAEAYIDFPEDEIEAETTSEILESLRQIKGEIMRLSRTFDEARFFREGLSVAIVGRPNVGKSSLLNALLRKDRAIVTETPGTTRDTIEDSLNINGLPVKIVDTAGIRNSDEAIEREGIRRSLDALRSADFAIVLLDGSEPLKDEDREVIQRTAEKNSVIAINKSDLFQMVSPEEIASAGRPHLRISAKEGEGIEELKSLIFRSNLRDWKEGREGVVVTNIRHKLALQRAGDAIDRAAAILAGIQPLEIFAIEVRDAADSIGEITGAVATEEILNRIFSDFCIGK